MQTFIGALQKLHTELPPQALQNPVQYSLAIGQEKIALNPLLQRKIAFRYSGEIFCIHCGRKTHKSFQQGYCFPCYRRLLACNLCIIHPARCRYHEGACPPDDWAHAHCGAPHVVYLANSSGLKVGITRMTQVPSRWIDQGATQGLVIMQVNNRWQAGQIEIVLQQYIADKTNWRAMLKSDNAKQDLIQARDQILRVAEQDLRRLQQQFADKLAYEIIAMPQLAVTAIQYPVLQYPTKIVNLNLDKNPAVEGRLLGIKGQYLLLDTGVFCVRKFGGYCVEFVC